jgi:hypothetical protein
MPIEPRGPAAQSSDGSAVVDPGADRAVVLFVRMWAVAHIIHLAAATDSSLDTPWNALVTVSALMLLLRPYRGPWLLMMAIAQLVDLVVEMPFSPDHWILIGAVNIAILVSMVLRRTYGLTAVAAALPAVRIVLLISYSAAALAKYNTTFLDPVMSCATAIANAAGYGIADRLDVGPLWVGATIVCETAIPILLAIPSTRRHGVRLGMAFHFILSASPAFAVVDYTAALYALFLLFLPVGEVARMLDWLGAIAARSAIARDARRWPPATAALAFVAFGLLGHVLQQPAAALLWLASELYLLGLLLAVLVTWRSSERRPRSIGRVSWAHVPVLLLVILWAANPYLGLRTTASFTMFSNLRTEGEVANHLFLPAARLTDWQDEFVVLEEANDPALASATGGVAGVPLLALRRLATDRPELVVSGTMDSQAITFGPDADQVPLEPLAGWQYKLLHFRPVAVGDRPFCSIS